MYNFKDKIEDCTEREFIELLGEFTNPTGDNAQLNGKILTNIGMIQKNILPELHNIR